MALVDAQLATVSAAAEQLADVRGALDDVARAVAAHIGE